MTKANLSVVADEFKIEKGTEPPVRGEKNRKYPFNRMQPGEYFVITNVADVPAISNAAYAYAKVHSQVFSIRRADGGHRCWRVA